MTSDDSGDRSYAGVEAASRKSARRSRLIEAGVDQLVAGQSITVRGVCKRAHLTTRYFYESFSDARELTRSVFDHVVEMVASAAWAAVTDAARVEEQRIRAGVSVIVDIVLDDPRIGRVLFAPGPPFGDLNEARADSVRMFVGLLAMQANDFYDARDDARLRAVSNFVVGGFGQVLTARLDGALALGRDELIDVCVDLLGWVAAGVRPSAS